ELSDQSYHDSLREIFTVILSRMGIAPSTMLIDQSYREKRIHSPFLSYINEISVLTNHLTHEISISGQFFLLTTFQKNIWNSIDKNRVVGISAPTSAGKSFALYLKIAEMIKNGATSFLYIVPTISLVNQVAKDLSNLFRNLDIIEIDIFTNYQANNIGSTVYVLTQERSIAAFSSNESFSGLDMLIVDEVQNIERVANEDDQRSKVLYDVLKELKHVVVPKKIVLSGPRLQNIGNLGFEIFDEVSDVAETKLPPVVNLTYSVSKRGTRYYFSQYCDIHSTPKKLSIENHEKISGIGGSIYNENFHEYLRSIISKFRDEEINLIFSPNPNQARKTALYLSNSIDKFTQSNLLEELSGYIKKFVHPDYDLAEIVKHGIAYHTGSLPLHVRAAIEEAFSIGLLKNVVCTTTLMQGVNFPASNIIVRNPNLFIKRKKGIEPPKLSNYEFSNLRGRAGRLLKDFIGRTVVLDESFFETDSPQGSLFEDTEKELTTGYGDYFNKYKEEIYEGIENASTIEYGPEKHILTHIRQTILRLGSNGIERLEEVGIKLEEDYFNAVKLSINSLKAPRNIILKNRYWDPLDIERLYELLQSNNIPVIPSNIWSSGLS
ncbi:MAG: DEAD/DEAH box helicase, partial [Candidatus Electrothrix sp. AUS4]|nr:DEAD/DEAH box helicase [Candidatus Electrothrix sp. AUS4]